MKLFILLSLLSVVSLAAALPPAEYEVTNVVDEPDVVLNPLVRSTRLLVRRQFIVQGASNQVRTVNYTFRSNARITRWSVSRVGAAQGASVTRTGGGVGHNNLSIRMTSARGRGFNYLVEIWGQ